jgi:hypothetical protein
MAIAERELIHDVSVWLLMLVVFALLYALQLGRLLE